jgi:hypothetical protein
VGRIHVTRADPNQPQKKKKKKRNALLGQRPASPNLPSWAANGHGPNWFAAA